MAAAERAAACLRLAHSGDTPAAPLAPEIGSAAPRGSSALQQPHGGGHKGSGSGTAHKAAAWQAHPLLSAAGSLPTDLSAAVRAARAQRRPGSSTAGRASRACARSYAPPQPAQCICSWPARLLPPPPMQLPPPLVLPMWTGHTRPPQTACLLTVPIHGRVASLALLG